jgi:zinc protease
MEARITTKIGQWLASPEAPSSAAACCRFLRASLLAPLSIQISEEAARQASWTRGKRDQAAALQTLRVFSRASLAPPCYAALCCVALLILGISAAATQRESPPNVAPPEPIALPTPIVRTLPNGLQVLVVERHSLPVFTLRLVVRAGPETDPPSLPGTAQFVASMFDEGTEHRSAIDIAQAVDGAGGVFDSNADWNNSFAELTVLADHIDLAFDLMADMAAHAAFTPAEVERTRKQTLSALDVLHQDPSYLADAVATQTVLAGTAYGHPADGTVDAIQRLRPQDLAGLYAREYVPKKSVLAVVGDISAESAFQQAARAFGGWTDSWPSMNQPQMTAPLPNASAVSGRRVLIIDKPDAVQTEIRVANIGVPRSSPDYLALTLANQILGGPASNRLFSDLRGDRGLTYSASSDLNCYLTAGTWVAKTSTRTPETVKAVERVLDEMKRMRDRAITTLELRQAVDYLTGHQALDFETSAGIAGQFLDLMTYRLALDTWTRYPAALRQLSPDEVWQATRRYLDPDRATIVLVGNSAAFGKDIKKLGPARVIPIANLDLGSPSLETAKKSVAFSAGGEYLTTETTEAHRGSSP